MKRYSVQISMVRKLVAATVCALCVASQQGCGAKDPADELDSADTDNTASVAMALSGADFSGNSVRITGSRATAADTKYPCRSTVNDCFNFDAAGHPLLGGVNGFNDLCPIEDVPSGAPGGLWSFTYAIWSGPNCTGTLLNAPGNPNNFVCYDITDLHNQDHPNQSVNETLHKGTTVDNTIVCTSKNARKTFDFNSCADITFFTPPLPFHSSVYDCGCTKVGLTCTCSQFDDTTPNLPPGCVFNTTTCTINC